MAGESQPTGFAKWALTALVGRHPKWTMVRLACLVPLAIFICVDIRPIRVFGPSMEPNYPDHSLNFLNRIAYLGHSRPHRGDVVGIRYLSNHVLLLKRIVGLPGETIAFVDGRIYINGQRLTEPYFVFASDWQRPGIKLGPDQYYFVGDNRSMRWEDHTQGTTSLKGIVGKVLLKSGP